MASRKDADLIAAVEANSLALVKKALAEGADPNARKKVVLSAKLDYKETKTDTIWAESALAIAVMKASVDVVAALVQAGADPGRPVQWRISRYGSSWSSNAWNESPWYLTFSWPSALALALTREGKAVSYKMKEFPTDTQNGSQMDIGAGKVWTNKPGGVVHLDTPSDFKNPWVEVTYAPRLDVVAVLLQHGGAGSINADLLYAAKTLGDKRFADLIEKRLEADYSTAVAVVTVRGGGGEDFKAQVDVLSIQVEQLTARFLADTDRLQHKVMDLEGVNRELRAKLQVAERQTAALSTRLEETTSRLSSRLDQTTTQLTQTATQLTQTATQLNLTTTRLDQTTADLSHSSTQTSARVTHLEHQLASHLEHHRSTHATGGDAQPAPPPPPVDVKRLMHVVANFVPSDPDEMQLAVGNMVFCNYRCADGWGSGFNATTNASGFFPMACLSDTPTPIPAPAAIAARTASVVVPTRASLLLANPFVEVRAGPGTPSTRVVGDVRGPTFG
ncbi:hypothetical protein HDU93_007975 [Gonapodya sp. JEL0774]|nr:hypothetical protein HDU93_007975 [Gonapodya sp. JEL0774]